MEITEQLVEELELVLLEHVDNLRTYAQYGICPSPTEIASLLCNTEYEDGKRLSSSEHTAGLASMAAIAMYWLAHKETER